MFLERIIFATILILSIVFFSLNVKKLIALLAIGKRENVFSHVFRRIWALIVYVFCQKRLFKDYYAGPMHFIIFWGFIVITFGTVETLISGVFPNFSYKYYLGDALYGTFMFFHDLMYTLVLIACLFALFRRYVLTPTRLDNKLSEKLDATIIILLILLLMLTGLFKNAFELHANPLSIREALPFSNFLSTLFPYTTKGSAIVITKILWWAHALALLFFLNYLPYSKHLHIFTSLPNVFFANLSPRGRLKSINLEDENAQSFGVGGINEFTWKDLLDGYSCTECGRCQEQCPAHATEKPLNPKEIITKIRKYLMKVGPEYLGGTSGNIKEKLLGDVIKHEELWACTTCGACVEACPLLIEHIKKIIDMRRNLVLMEGSFPQEVAQTLRGWEVNSNPWSIGFEERGNWAKGLNLKKASEAKDFEYLYYAGCACSLDEKGKKISLALVNLLKKAKVNFAVLENEELCCGETARRIGNEYLAQTMIKANIEVLKKYNVKKIITACPHCYNTLKNEYPDFGGNFKVFHHSEVLSRMLKDKKIGIKETTIEKRVVYHDSCYLGRYNKIYNEPRNIIDAAPNMKRKELKRNCDKSFCCGAGGGRMWMEETLGKRINEERTRELVDKKPSIIATACPYCLTMISDGLKALNKESNIEIKDVAEILNENT